MSSLYLHDIPLDEAKAAWYAELAACGAFGLMPKETVPLAQALGRITAGPVWAKISSPHYHASAMDGYAVRSGDTHGASEAAPKHLSLSSQAIYVDTGDPLPAGMNAVIMRENIQLIAGGEEELATAIEIIQAVAPWQHVRAMGEDMVASEMVLTALHRIRPQDLGALAGSGHGVVEVLRQPRVAIIPTGTELVTAGSAVKPGDIIEYNSLVLGGFAEQCGAIVSRYPIQPDRYDEIKHMTEAALAAHDLVIINAGSSAGSEDFTSRVIGELGKVCVHGVAIRPGHPVILGTGAGKALVGLPGYPVSAAVTFDLFCKPLLRRWQGEISWGEGALVADSIEATLTRKVLSPMGDDEFLRVSLGRVGERVVATPIGSGAGVITSMVKADGVLHIPRFKEGFHAGETVRVNATTPKALIDRTILAIGSHDLTIDLLANQLKIENLKWKMENDITQINFQFSIFNSPFPRLVSAHVGSQSGLLALQRGEAHLAGSHLLDEDGGDDTEPSYNLGSIAKLLTPFGVRVQVLGFVKRVQGLMVCRGNPKAILGLDDLTRNGVTFVNRQRGAGTRMLLDDALKKRGIHPRHIAGYERQEYTHLSVAAAVASGACDCGLGILAAARALDLDFVPLFNERYDLIIPIAHYESDLLQPLLRITRSPAFAEQVQSLGGYDTAQMGQVLATV
ncbi:MAG: molybdopterin biosynthesis protein [Anaerolineae bacterium]|nr:molybdopterin biosynthesis protein [Anaerolineae bacterium]